MSAFYDIWIGGEFPLYTRIGNAGWEKYTETETCFLSLPEDRNTHFAKSYSNDKHTLLVIGQFYEPVELLSLLAGCLRYIKGEKAVFEDPAGHYILFLFDKQSGECHAFTNRFGTYHAYWLNNGKQKAISTYFLGLARQSINKSLDWEGLTGFFGMGFFPGNKTYLNSIEILAPATYYRFDASMQLTGSKRYWNWDAPSLSYSGTEYFEVLHDAISKSLSSATAGHRLALPISGGLDSRMLAGISTASDLKYKSLWSYSYGYGKRSMETSIASKIARARNIPFQSNHVPNYLFDELPTITEAVELFQYVDGTRQAFMKNDIAANADLVIGGHWGDVWMDGVDIVGNETLFNTFDKKILKRGRHWLLKEIAENFQHDSSSYLREYFNGAMSQYAHIEDAERRFKAFKTDQWSFRWTLASIRMYQAAAFPVLPFYDKNVVDLLLAIPAHKMKGRKMQIEFIKRYQPDLAKISWQEYGRDLYSYKYLNNRNVVYRAARKARRVVTGEKSITRNWELFYLTPSGRKNLESRLLDNAKLKEFVDEGKVQKLIDELYHNPSGANGYSISMLLTFGEALNKIFS